VSGSLRRTTTLLLYSTISCVFIIISSTVQYNILYTCILHIWYSEPSLFPRLVRIHSRGSVLIFHRKHAATNIFSRALLCILYNNIHIYRASVLHIPRPHVWALTQTTSKHPTVRPPTCTRVRFCETALRCYLLWCAGKSNGSNRSRQWFFLYRADEHRWWC